MATSNARRIDLSAVLRAPLVAMQWRLLLLWVVCLLLPTALVTVPLWRALADLLDRSVHAGAWAGHFDALMAGDTLGELAQGGAWFRGSALLATVCALLLGPFLTGMTVAAGRAGRVLGLGQLLQSGVIEYGRMFRLMVWSLLPYAIAIGLGAMALAAAGKQAERAVLEGMADRYHQTALWLLGVLFLLAHAVVESARAAFIVDPGLRSATRALGRGFVQLLRRPLATLLTCLVIGVIGYAIAFALGVGRLHTPALGLGGFLLALLLAELVVLATGWTRVARLFALAAVGRSLAPRRGGFGAGR